MVIELPELLVADADRWHDWLSEHHLDSPGVWLVLARKGSVEPTSLTYDAALDEALCHGWIDGQIKRRDDRTTSRRFTPRTRTSRWSARNVAHIQRLSDQGRLVPAGVAAVEAAQADGRWAAAYAGPATIEVPADLAEALAASPAATTMFAGLTSQNRYAILYRLQTVARADLRRRHLERYIAMLERGETLYPQPVKRKQE